jgi:hypothetical protein
VVLPLTEAEAAAEALPEAVALAEAEPSSPEAEGLRWPEGVTLGLLLLHLLPAAEAEVEGVTEGLCRPAL